jgi:hypothetical protein
MSRILGYLSTATFGKVPVAGGILALFHSSRDGNEDQAFIYFLRKTAEPVEVCINADGMKRKSCQL